MHRAALTAPPPKNRVIFAAVGVATFVLSGGLDKFSIVLGPFFLIASLMSVARQAGWLSAELEAPKLIILLGVLLLLARWKAIPLPPWFAPSPYRPKSASESPGKPSLK